MPLGEAFRDRKPVLLTINYFRCKMLCNLQLNALTHALRRLAWTPGREFRVVTVSMDPREGPQLAREKRHSYLQELGRGGEPAGGRADAHDRERSRMARRLLGCPSLVHALPQYTKRRAVASSS